MSSKKLLLTLLLFAGAVRADDQVRAVQEELRRRNVYFGDIDGQKTPELEEATKRYQKRKGFAATGSEDRDTLRSLGLLARAADEAPPAELVWPQEPILKSDKKIDVAAEAVKIGAEAGVAPASIAPDAVAAQKAEVPAKPAAILVKSTAIPEPITGGNATAATPPTLAPDLHLELGEVNQLQQFVARYMKALGRNDVRDELRLYGDRVSYYSNGEVDRRIIERNLKSYYQRWPSRKYKVDKIMKVRRLPKKGEIVVTFLVNFTLKNKGKKVSGQTENRLTINAASADPRIVSIEESRVRS